MQLSRVIAVQTPILFILPNTCNARVFTIDDFENLLATPSNRDTSSAIISKMCNKHKLLEGNHFVFVIFCFAPNYARMRSCKNSHRTLFVLSFEITTLLTVRCRFSCFHFDLCLLYVFVIV